ncbi:SH3-containing GRB2-like protein 3-interacting protein 1 isoform X5 [Astyanax mexicanus]|uniref:SH3-containing GRB2-like protein 3-interacting protein 1 isoform X5 n=1 Tax=Astyanax mexicanus TaxID=7994 RepID=UPI0020CB3C3D|nr:SH3-containing GRB2-like protein 3-interacting protein 1 isoform X5 [Astyanax mexicanus]
MMEGLKKRTRKAFGIRKKEKDTDSTGSPDRDGGESLQQDQQQIELPPKKTNGAPNGFYGEIDWDRYNSPMVDDEGYSIRPDEEGESPKEKRHFFSSSESEEEEDHRKKFKIKIKPLPADSAEFVAPSVDELKASIGNIALSPSLLRSSPRRSPGLGKRNAPGDEIARPRRSIPTAAPIAAPSPTPTPPPAPAPAPAPAPQPPSSKRSPVPEDATALFGPPLETAFDEQKTEVMIEEPEVWGAPLRDQNPDSTLGRPFPSGTLPPLPPKNVPTSPPPISSPTTESAADADVKAEDNPAPTQHRPSIADLDNIFGPADSPKPTDNAADTWVCFNEESSERPPSPPDEPAPPLPTSPPPPAEPAPPLPKSPPPPEEPVPPLPKSPPPPGEPAPPLPTAESPRGTTPSPPAIPPPPKETTPSPPTILPPPPKETTPSPPAVPPPPEEEAPPPPVELAPPNKASTPPTQSVDTGSGSAISPPSTLETNARTIPPPLVLNQEEKTSPEELHPKEDPSGSSASPKEVGLGPRSTPPPPPPPTYRAVVSSPGPVPGAVSGGSGSGSSSPARPATPLAASSPPPPPPRPPSRPKLAPGKASSGDVNRPFSPPMHSSSPPPIAPLARAESTSSISSTNSLSAATTPTVDDAFVDKLPSFEKRADLPAETDQPSLVWFDRGKFYLTFEGCSRGPSPLTMGAQDTLPVAAAFTETVNSYFKGTDPSKCVVKITGEMVLSFPAGITRHFANNPSPAVLTFSITNYSRLEHVLPNPQLLCCDTTQSNPNSKEFWVNMTNLMAHLKKVAEQKPQATYYNVDMLKYQVSAQGPQSTPLNLAVNWRCEPTSTDLRIDYKYNGNAMTTPVALNNVQFLIPVDGGVNKLQAVLPPAAWNAEQQRILWKIPDISQKSENGGVGSLLARFQLTDGPSKPAPLAVQFTSEGSTLSGCDIELVGPGYRFSLIKKRFAAGKYMADN